MLTEITFECAAAIVIMPVALLLAALRVESGQHADFWTWTGAGTRGGCEVRVHVLSSAEIGRLD
jgi:hypothetical protein